MTKVPFSNEELEAFRNHADPLGDDVIEKIMQTGEGRSISELFNQLIRNNDYDKIELPAEVQAYFESTSVLPAWVDSGKIKIGQSVFAEFGPEICLLLMCKSLPEAYACKKGALVMYQTGRMQESDDGSLKRFTRRLMETSQFVVNVCTPGGFGPDGAGLITAQKVRLIHATIRYFIKEGGHWDAAENGLPINQEDLAGTLQSFSALIIEGLAQLGITLTKSQQDGYYHCWRVAGHVVGLADELNPATYEEGLALGYAILDQQKAPSEAGTVLTKAVHDFMAGMMPGNILDETPAILMRYFLGDKTADILEIEEENGLFAQVLPKVLKTVFKAEEHLEKKNGLYKEIASRVSLAMLQGMLNYFNDYKGVHFYIPPSLTDNWKLDVDWEHHKTISPAIAGYRIAIEKKTTTL